MPTSGLTQVYNITSLALFFAIVYEIAKGSDDCGDAVFLLLLLAFKNYFKLGLRTPVNLQTGTQTLFSGHAWQSPFISWNTLSPLQKLKIRF